MRISDWSSDVCSSDLRIRLRALITATVIGLLFGAITTLLWYGAEGVAQGTITGGTIAAFVLTGGLVAGAFGALTEVYGDLLRAAGAAERSEEHTSELQSLMRISYAVFCLKKKKNENTNRQST